jgi:hypothetical protein
MTKPLPEILLRCPECKKDVPSKLVRLSGPGVESWAHRVPIEHGCSTPKEKHMHKAFEVHLLNDQGKAKAAKLATGFNALLEEITPIVEDPRLLAIVTTKLEEACFFAKKGMASAAGNTEAK